MRLWARAFLARPPSRWVEPFEHCAGPLFAVVRDGGHWRALPWEPWDPWGPSKVIKPPGAAHPFALALSHDPLLPRLPLLCPLLLFP